MSIYNQVYAHESVHPWYQHLWDISRRDNSHVVTDRYDSYIDSVSAFLYVT